MTIRMKMADLAQLSRISAPLKRASQHAFQSASWHLTRGSACYSAMIYGKFLRKTRFIGITGSAGKTTTKDLVMGILSESARCGGTRMSFNQATGVARGILQTRLNDDYCVLEVSGGRPHDMDWPLRMFTPDVAVLTLVEREHVKSSIGLDVILKEKRRLVDALPNDGVAVLNIDDPMIRTLGESCTRRIIWVGASDGATVRLIEAQSRWPSPLTLKISFNGTEHHVRTQLHGTHLALSVLSALGVAIACGLDLDRALPALERVRPTTGRMQVVDSEGGITFVRDDWKAPWWSLQAPLAFMREATAKRKNRCHWHAVGLLTVGVEGIRKGSAQCTRRSRHGRVYRAARAQGAQGCKRPGWRKDFRVSGDPGCGAILEKRTTRRRPSPAQGLEQGGSLGPPVSRPKAESRMLEE